MIKLGEESRRCRSIIYSLHLLFILKYLDILKTICYRPSWKWVHFIKRPIFIVLSPPMQNLLSLSILIRHSTNWTIIVFLLIFLLILLLSRCSAVRFIKIMIIKSDDLLLKRCITPFLKYTNILMNTAQFNERFVALTIFYLINKFGESHRFEGWGVFLYWSGLHDRICIWQRYGILRIKFLRAFYLGLLLLRLNLYNYIRKLTVGYLVFHCGKPNRALLFYRCWIIEKFL